VSLGKVHTLVLAANGTVYCTGDGSFGQCGDTSSGLSFRTITGISEVITTIHAARFASYAVKADGTVLVFGLRLAALKLFYHSYLPLGNPGVDSVVSAPVPVPWFTDNASWAGRISRMCSGTYFTTALMSTGIIVSWGLNDATTPAVGNASAPSIAFQPYVLNTTAFSPGEHPNLLTCSTGYGAVWTDQNRLYTWGGEPDAYLTYQRILPQKSWANRVPTSDAWLGSGKVVSIAGNTDAFFVLTNTSKLNGTGWVQFGDLGDNNWQYAAGSSPTITLPSQFMTWVGTNTPVQLVTADFYTMILLSNGEIWSTGTNLHGEMGLSEAQYGALNRNKPEIVAVGGQVLDVGCTESSTILVLANTSMASAGTKPENLGCSSLQCPIQLSLARASPYFRSVATLVPNATQIFSSRTGAFVRTASDSYFSFGERVASSHDFYLGRPVVGESDHTPLLDLVLNGSLSDLKLAASCGFALSLLHELKAFGAAGCVESPTDPVTVATGIKFAGVAEGHLVYSDGQNFWAYTLGTPFSAVNALPQAGVSSPFIMTHMAVGKQYEYHVIAAFRNNDDGEWALWGYGDNSRFQAIGAPYDGLPSYKDEARDYLTTWQQISLSGGLGDIVQLEAGAWVR
jgi:alpha-tubulin suppressor-like RCC1 family protein